MICEKCLKWYHQVCIGKTEEQLQNEYPNEYICKQCEDLNSNNNKGAEQKEEKKKISILTTEAGKENNEIEMDESKWEKKYQKMEEENKQLKKEITK